jgi:hypothetical protein
MTALASFASALLAEQSVCPPGLQTWNGSDPARRFAVYRNNVVVSLIDALADTYPVARQLVGEDFFRSMARIYARGNPPVSPVLASYGAGFAAFIAAFPSAAAVPYLADIARLEWMYVRSFYAADVDPVETTEIAALLADAEGLPQAHFELHPSVTVMASAYAVASLWAAHQDLLSLSGVHPEMAESVLVQRIGLSVEVQRIGRGTMDFISRVQQGECLAAAADAALDIDSSFDLARCLALLIHSGAIVAIHTPGNPTP